MLSLGDFLVYTDKTRVVTFRVNKFSGYNLLHFATKFVTIRVNIHFEARETQDSPSPFFYELNFVFMMKLDFCCISRRSQSGK